MANHHGEWCTIESDPGVFTELIREFGVKGLQVEELWGLDEELFSELKPIHGLIFLFKWVPDPTTGNGRVLGDDSAHNIYFAKQVIQNACATQAILNLLLNLRHPDLQLGDTLDSFKSFTQDFDSALRGQALNNCDQIRTVHNSFARSEVFETLSRKLEKDEDVFHFIGYIPVNGRLIELDGLQEGPIDHGEIPAGQEWITFAKPVIEERMQRYLGNEIRFTLLALVTDRRLVFNRRMEELQKQYENMPSDEILLEMSEIKQKIEEQEEKDMAVKIENIRRKHNFLPFIVELFKVLSTAGKLTTVYDEAVRLGKERQEKNKKLKLSSG